MPKKEPLSPPAVPESEKPWVGIVESHFLDSGAFTLKTKAIEYAKANPGKSEWDYYDTADFWEYIDEYAEFVTANKIAIDHFANVDVLPNSAGTPNPELTWRNQQYLEKKTGFTPVPTVHYKTDLKWLRHYMDKGYEFIGLGGLVGSTAQEHCRGWIDRCFELVCRTPTRCPSVRLHGFGVTTYELIIRYPWYSVDSTSWTKVGAYGGILVPHKRRGSFVFDEQPYLMKMSLDSPDRKMRGRHFLTMPEQERAIVLEWLKHINIPLGTWDPKTFEGLTPGVCTHHTERRAANLHFFEEMRKSLPAYPWPFKSVRPKGRFESLVDSTRGKRK